MKTSGLVWPYINKCNISAAFHMLVHNNSSSQNSHQLQNKWWLTEGVLGSILKKVSMTSNDKIRLLTYIVCISWAVGIIAIHFWRRLDWKIWPVNVSMTLPFLNQSPNFLNDFYSYYDYYYYYFCLVLRHTNSFIK